MLRRNTVVALSGELEAFHEEGVVHACVGLELGFEDHCSAELV